MDRPDITSYSVLDLLSWQELGALEVSPKFQRRSVWNTAAKSYFVDSVLQQYPVPPVHIRMTKGKNDRLVREVIDGQQRMRAVFDFIADAYRIPPSVSPTLKGKSYSTLSEEQRDRINTFSFTVYQYKTLTDSEVLDMFARLNTYSVQLSAQELRNGKWFGAFKQLSFRLGSQTLEFWRSNGILTERQIARMREAELVSELLVAELDGLQDGKKSLDTFYENLDDSWGSSPTAWSAGREETLRTQPANYLSAEVAEHRLLATLAAIDAGLGGVLIDTPFRRPALFYTLFCTYYHLLFGLPRADDLALGRQAITPSVNAAVRQAVDEVSTVFKRKGRTRDQVLSRFYIESARQTDNIGPRRARLTAFLTAIQRSA